MFKLRRMLRHEHRPFSTHTSQQAEQALSAAPTSQRPASLFHRCLMHSGTFLLEAARAPR